MRSRTRSKMTPTALIGGAVLTAGAVLTTGLAPAVHHPAEPAEPLPAVTAPTGTAVEAAAVETSLTRLEDEADRAGRAAQIADEALLDSPTAAHRAAAARATAALQALAAEQTPALGRLAARAEHLGLRTRQAVSTGPVAATAALTARTRAARAISFARSKLGDPYAYAGAGPTRWDCSGLTMKAYAAASVGIGGHSATRQWALAKRDHRLHLWQHRQRGDLIFYGRPGAVYHVAIYVGHGRMIEAPYPGKPVREVPVRSADRLPNVGRPA